MFHVQKAATAVAVLSGVALAALVPAAEARTFGCVDIDAPSWEGDYAGWRTRATRVAFDEADVHPMQLWWRLYHWSELYNNSGQLIGQYYQVYYRGWGPGDSTIYVRWWVLPPGVFTMTADIQSQYSTGYPVPDHEYRSCFVPVPFG